MNLNANTFGAFLFGDLLPVNILDVTEDRYMLAIQQFLARENQFLQQLTGILADSGPEPQTGFVNGVGGRFQKMTKRGGVETTRGGQRWWTGYPIFAFGNEQAYEIAWMKRAKFVDLAYSILQAVLQDVETVIHEMLYALLRNDTYTFDDSQWPGMHAVNLIGVNASGPISVKPLANADGSAGSIYNFGKEILLASLNHYLVSGGANPTIANFNTIKAALRNVGNDTQIVHVVSRTTADYIQQNFSSTDFIQPIEVLQRFSAQDLFGKYATQSYGLFDTTIRTRGRLSDFGELVEWPHFPDGYCFSYDATKEPPLRMRVSDQADEQGLAMAPADPNMPDVMKNPLVGKKWRRIMGFGARNRGNGVVMQFTTNGSYTIPTIG